MLIEFIKKQIMFNGKFFTGECKWKRFLVVMIIGTIFQLFANSIVNSLGVNNIILKNSVSGILWFIISFLIINCLVRINNSGNFIKRPINIKFLAMSNLLFTNKTNKEIFEPIISDWQEEYFEALFKKEIWKARWINVRYTYAFLAAMWQKSPIGDLLEFVSKFAK